jgi:signal transduction histidine kinase
LKAYSASLEDHLTAVAHDLRTPLSVIQLELELEWLNSHENDPRSRKSIQGCLDNAVYMTALTDNLRTEAGLKVFLGFETSASLSIGSF